MSVQSYTPPEDVADLLTTRFAADFGCDGPPRIDAAMHLALARALRDELGYRIFGFVVASHHPATQTGGIEYLHVHYALRTVGPGSKLAMWQIELGPDQAVDSLTSLFAGADWQEREQYDLLGVRFLKHPDLRRLMLPEDWKGHPLRKDYAIDTEVTPWR